MQSSRYTIGNTVARGRRVHWFAASLLVLILCAPLSTATADDDSRRAQELVEKARLTLANFRAAPEMEPLRKLMKNANGVLIIPQLLKGAFVVGAQGGSGVLMVRQGSGSWSYPAFYTVSGVSFGLQIGGEAAEVILVAMTERGVSAMQQHTFKLGADASVALGPIGVGAEAATALASVDIISFARAKGLYAGLSLEGSVVTVREDWNTAYYGQSVSPSDILLNRTVRNPHAASLIGDVTKVAVAR